MSDDKKKEFLDALQHLNEGDTFNFKCYPGISCFNQCCRDLNMVLTPYDVQRMRTNLGISSDDFIDLYCDVTLAPGIDFPVLRLRMSETPERTCHFMRPEGCSIYPDRPGACRCYPIGRGTRPDGKGGVEEQFVVVQEDHCTGFKEPDEWTSETWLEDQGFDIYVDFNDRFMNLLAKLQEREHGVPAHKLQMVMVAMYKTEDFQDLISKSQIFEKLDIDEARQKAILEDEEETLRFAFEWQELMFMGSSATLKPRRSGCGSAE